MKLPKRSRQEQPLAGDDREGLPRQTQALRRTADRGFGNGMTNSGRILFAPLSEVEPQTEGSFSHHDFRPRMEAVMPPPRVLISAEAYKRMAVIVEVAPLEVGWLGTVDRLDNGDFFIDQVYLLQQEVTGVETELDTEGQAQLMMYFMEREEDEQIDRLRFWGHSHVRMGTSPSGTDENTPLRFQQDGVPWFVRGIFNKLGRAEFTVYDFELGLRWCDVPWDAVESETGRILKVHRRVVRDLVDGSVNKESSSIEGATPFEERGSERVGDEPKRRLAGDPSARSGRNDGSNGGTKGDTAGATSIGASDSNVPEQSPQWRPRVRSRVILELPPELVVSDELREEIRREYKEKVRERRYTFFGRGDRDERDRRNPRGKRSQPVEQEDDEKGQSK